MGEQINLDISLRVFLRKEKKTRWAAVCPSIGVASQGTTRDDARRALQEAIGLWFESCIDRGVLEQALREANFRPPRRGESPSLIADSIIVEKGDGYGAFDVRGDSDVIHIEIPGYQAAALLSAGV